MANHPLDNAVKLVGGALLALLRAGIEPTVVEAARIAFTTVEGLHGMKAQNQTALPLLMLRVEAERSETGDATRALLLHYVIIPWTRNPDSEQRIAGRLLVALERAASLPLGEGGAAMTIRLEQWSQEQHAAFWHAVQLPYRASFPCLVRVPLGAA